MNLANSARKTLIRIGKVLPFAISFVVAVTYAEYLYAMLCERFLYYHDYTVLDTPISYAIANWFEYDWHTVIITFVISIAINACKWNLWAVCFLFIHLLEKHYLVCELNQWQIYVIITINLLAALFFTFKGIFILKNIDLWNN